jgi:hypothetical protein
MLLLRAATVPNEPNPISEHPVICLPTPVDPDTP